MHKVILLNRRWLLPATLLFIILCFALPVNAHLPVSADGNTDINTALTIEKPTMSYVIYGHLHEAGEVDYYQLKMNPNERLVLSLMTPGYNAPVPDMIVVSPGTAVSFEGLPQQVSVPQGYGAEIIRGRPPHIAEYEPFGPAPVFEVAYYSKEITAPGLYYLAVVSTADETRYSIATGYEEEFTPSEWVLVPVNVISTHLWEGQSILAILTPFLAVVILGFVVISRREKRRGSHLTHSCWLATIAGLCYLGGAAITLVQMVRALAVTGPSSSVALTLVFALIPVTLGVWALRLGRSSSRRTILDRAFLVLIAILGLIIWAGLIIGPVLAIGAAALPERLPFHHPANK
ncbi:MAG: hypothetical protein Q7V05_02140 [Methanoregula sp.]|nr:hypothetical protein [Methanoregula sp.]MDP2797945.1 hypothetical protein [Methanoregula sp.]